MDDMIQSVIVLTAADTVARILGLQEVFLYELIISADSKNVSILL